MPVTAVLQAGRAADFRTGGVVCSGEDVSTTAFSDSGAAGSGCLGTTPVELSVAENMMPWWAKLEALTSGLAT